ncbi:putative serine carboxypeptidase [Rhizodiscina lignyota]|uniref:Carboxypeptidase n=1 Tax=Rhizodiscina lignyota TaxID=1504668 RepID=A0A9P4MED1_9PEZI|nr:putative serine carboxypeptidase [Rhizodiscina lignyota]
MVFTFLSLLLLHHVFASPQKRVQKYNHIKNQRTYRSIDAPESFPSHFQTRATPQYLTNKTQRFAVDGANLPNVSFDIGESYAGLLPVDNTGKELFFWFVPTTNTAANDEIVIWLNGGPGCSSLDGFFKENGPVTWLSGTFQPVPNQYAWTNLSNMVWIDQPVGTGYDQGMPNATGEIDVGKQFLPFWRNFMDTFDLHGRKVYITGESYAGAYVPYIADAMIQQNNTQYFDVNGIMIFDATVGDSVIANEVPTLAFIEYNYHVLPLNETFMAYLRNTSAACGYDDYMKVGMTFPPEGPLPGDPGLNANQTEFLPGCEIFNTVIEAIFLINPCFNIYQVSQLCPLLWDVLGFPYSNMYLPPGYPNPYFNMSAVKTALHVPQNTSWDLCSAISVFPHDDDSPPSGAPDGPIKRVAEKTNNVVIGHGLLDMVLMANGTLLTLQNLTWNGKQGFSSPPATPFYVPYHLEGAQESWAGAGEYGRFVTERGLTFLEVTLSGHMIPQFQPSAAYRAFEFLLGRVKSLDEISPFSTQPDVKQPNVTLESLGPPIDVPAKQQNRDSRNNSYIIRST